MSASPRVAITVTVSPCAHAFSRTPSKPIAVHGSVESSSQMKPMVAAAEAAGARAAPHRLIAEPRGGLHHALPRLVRKARAVGVVEHERHRGLRDARLVGDVGHGRAARL